MSLVVKNIYTHNPFALSGVSNSLYRSGSVSFAESVSLKRAKPIAVSYNTSIVGLYVYAARDKAQVNYVQSVVTAKFPRRGRFTFTFAARLPPPVSFPHSETHTLPEPLTTSTSFTRGVPHWVGITFFSSP